MVAKSPNYILYWFTRIFFNFIGSVWKFYTSTPINDYLHKESCSREKAPDQQKWSCHSSLITRKTANLSIMAVTRSIFFQLNTKWNHLQFPIICFNFIHIFINIQHWEIICSCTYHSINSWYSPSAYLN